MKINSLLLTLKTGQPIVQTATMLRGFISGMFPNLHILHQHEKDGFVYIYPRVQYKIINGIAFIVTIDEGADIVRENFDKFDKVNHLELGRIVYQIEDKARYEKEVEFGETGRYFSYSFLTPWLALNESNYERYQRLGSWTKRKELLEKILIGNIISMSKGLSYTVPAPIKANIIKLKEVQTSLKGTPMLGFLGTFSVNFEIPDYWGIGKSVSRGFGTVKKVRQG